MSHQLPTSHRSAAPQIVIDFFNRVVDPSVASRFDTEKGMLIEQVFYPGKGWRRHPISKRISGSEIRRLRTSGATGVAIRYAGHLADFNIPELTRVYRPAVV